MMLSIFEGQLHTLLSLTKRLHKAEDVFEKKRCAIVDAELLLTIVRRLSISLKWISQPCLFLLSGSMHTCAEHGSKRV